MAAFVCQSDDWQDVTSTDLSDAALVNIVVSRCDVGCGDKQPAAVQQ